jgi:hypothetical protein
MRLLYLPQKEEAKIKNILKNKDRFHTIIIASEYGKYRKGDYVKTNFGERLIVIDTKIMKDFETFKKEIVHHPELKDTNLEEIKQAFTHKKIEIIELKKYRK